MPPNPSSRLHPLPKTGQTRSGLPQKTSFHRGLGVALSCLMPTTTLIMPRFPTVEPCDDELTLKGDGLTPERTRSPVEEKNDRERLGVPSKTLPDRETVDPNEVGWDGPNDPCNPQNWSSAYKWMLTVLVSLQTINVTFASSAPSSTSMALTEEFGISIEVSFLITSLFMAGFIPGPIIWSTGSELIGRRAIYIGSTLIYAFMILGQIYAKNAQTLFITRFFSGVFSSAPLTNGGGVIADIWGPAGRGYAMTLFTTAVFIGPVMGPIIGSFVTASHLGWRWVFWVLFIFSMVSWVLSVSLLPETFAPVLLLRKAQRLRKEDPANNVDLYAPHEKTDWTFHGIVQRTVYRPFVILALEPILVLITVYLGVVYGLLYGLFEAFPVIWGEVRGFSLVQVGLVFIGLGIGTIMAGVLNAFLQLKYRTLTPLWKGFPPPEERLIGAMIAGPILVVGIFFLGWTGAYPSIPWYVPALSTPMLGMSFTLVFMSFFTYIIDSYLMYAASAFAATTILRSAVGAAFPLFTRQMFLNLGVQWACTLFGCISLLLAPSPYLFYIYGSRVRAHSRFTPAVDLEIRKQLEADGLLPQKSNVHEVPA